MVNAKRYDELEADDLQEISVRELFVDELKWECTPEMSLDPMCGRTTVRCNSTSSFPHPKLPLRPNQDLTSASPISASRVFVRYSKNSGLNIF